MKEGHGPKWGDTLTLTDEVELEGAGDLNIFSMIFLQIGCLHSHNLWGQTHWGSLNQKNKPSSDQALLLDGIHPGLLKALKVVGLCWLTWLLNIAWTFGMVSLDWQTGIVDPHF